MTIDYDKARQTMVDCQIRPNDVTSPAVLRAFLSVPREAFVSAAQKPLSYIDEDLPLSEFAPSRYLMEAMSLSKLIQLADVQPDDIVLDVGCATGYSTAVLSKLCSSVVAVESDEHLANQASQNLMDLGCDNAVVTNGPLETGLASEGPYDVIFVGGSVETLPDTFSGQLKEGGRLVVVEGTGNSGVAKLYQLENGILGGQTAFNCAVMPLPGFEKAKEFVF
ncbi:MAG: protein-L-isoaspartate O-methyltransferase family protein [Rhizobiaceae bacterium]